jgi:hypothetical protein
MSSLFGSSNNLPQYQPRPFGLQQVRANTNQQARPVPLLYGKQRLSLTFLTDLFDPLAIPVTQSVGKKQEQTGNNYYASFAGLVCAGPVDGIYDIFFNGEPVYTSNDVINAVSLTSAGVSGDTFYTATFQTANPHGLPNGATVFISGADQAEYNGEFVITVVSPTQFQYSMPPTDVSPATANQFGYIWAQIRLDPVLRDDTNPDFADITIPDYGVMRIYWGTETQTADDYVSNTLGMAQPAYLGQCYVVFTQLYFGYNQTNCPNIELVIGRFPKPTWGEQTNNIDDEANPVYVMADLLQNARTGLGASDEQLETTTFETTAALMATESLGVSAVMDRQQDLKSILGTLGETVDVIPAIDFTDWIFSLLAIRNRGGGTDLTDDDLTDLPQFDPSDWSTTNPATWVSFQNRDLGYTDDTAIWRDIGALNVLTNPDILQLRRDWVTRADLAQAMANASGQAAAIPLITGRLKLPYDDAVFASFAPGNPFSLDYSARDMSGLNLRVTSRTWPDPEQPEFEIEFQADRTYLYAFLTTTPVITPFESLQPPGTPVPDPIVVVIPDRLLLFELPPALCPGQPAIATAWARDSKSVTSFQVWLNRNKIWSGAAPDSYALMVTATQFALHGTLATNYPKATRVIDLELGATVQLDGGDTVLDDITAFEALTNTMLIFIDGEILSLAGRTLIAAGVYRLQLIRGRFGTPIQNHAPGVKVMIMSMATLPIITSLAFQPDNIADIKIVPNNRALTDTDATLLTLCGTAWRVPAPSALQVNGRDASGGGAVFPGGAANVTVSWQLPDAGGILPRFDLATLYTRIKVYKGPTADLTGITADSTVVTADGGVITPETGTLLSTTDVAHDIETLVFNFAALNGGLDVPFLVTAETMVDIGWKQILSADKACLRVMKYP